MPAKSDNFLKHAVENNFISDYFPVFCLKGNESIMNNDIVSSENLANVTPWRWFWKTTYFSSTWNTCDYGMPCV